MLPTLGSKEAIYNLAPVVVGRDSPRDLIAVTTPGYPVPERSALFAGAGVVEVPLDPAAGWLPAIETIDEATWRRLAVLWINTPSNPTGAVAPLAFLRELAERCRRSGVVLACDEAYSEIWLDGDPPPSVLQTDDPTGVLAFHSLSKRSSVPGYRSGFVAGDPLLIAALKQTRPEHRGRAADVPAARGDRRVGRRAPRRRGTGALPGQARGAGAGAARRRPRARRRAGRLLPVVPRAG